MDDAPLISPEKYIQYMCRRRGWDLDEVRLSPTVIIAMPMFMGIFRKELFFEKVEKTVIRNHYRNQNVNVSLVEARMGAPLMAMSLEDMIALGGSRFIHLGFAGGICTDMKPGDIVITTGALNETGIPPLYGFDDPLIPSDLRLTDALLELARRKNIQAKSGIHWCTDAPYRETWEKVNKYVNEGALCVEMEGSALFSVSKHYGVSAAAVYVITDIVGENGWQQAWNSPKIPEGCWEVVNLIISFVKKC